MGLGRDAAGEVEVDRVGGGRGRRREGERGRGDGGDGDKCGVVVRTGVE